MDKKIESIKRNLFPESHKAITNWGNFDWHQSKGQIDTDKPNSSQALAIDVFGTIKMSPEKDQILNKIADWLKLPNDEKWEIELEWKGPKDLLNEKVQTQVDAIAISSKAVILFECKFTEGGGNCSQPNKIQNGPNKGFEQCNGRYELQKNPVENVEAKCTLTGKGIRYWDYIEKVFEGIDANQDYKPCPFKDGNYQWMRNLVLCKAFMESKKIDGAVVAIYTDAPGFPMAKKINNNEWTIKLNDKEISFCDILKENIKFETLSYQELTEMVLAVSSSQTWHELKEWIENKINK